MKSLIDNIKGIGKGLKKVGPASLGATMVFAPSIDVAAKNYVEGKAVNKTEYNASVGDDFDRTKLAGMDFYSRPSIVPGWNYENLDWNNFTRQDKIDWANNRFKDYQHLMSNNVDCKINTDIITLNFEGIDNFENYIGFDRDNDGNPEGYEFYKNKVQNGIENIPMYSVTFKINEGGDHHNVPGLFVGPKNPSEKINPLDINQWYFINYKTGEEAKIGEYIDPNEYLTIGWNGWQPNAFGTWKHSENQMIHFDLNNSVATVEAYDDDMLKESPHQLYVNGEYEEIAVERGEDVPDLSVEKYGIPSVESNAEFNKPVVSHVSSKFTPFNKNHPEYGVKEDVFKGEINIGRWNGNNLEALVDTMKRRITVDDTIEPLVNAPEDVTIGYNASLGVDRTGMPTSNDASPYALNEWFEDREISDDGNFRKIERTFYSEDVRGNVGSDSQVITVDLNVGIEEAEFQGGFDIEQNYPNPVSSITTVPYYVSTTGNVTFEIWGMSGELLGKKTDFAEDPGIHEFELGMHKYIPGTYLLKANYQNNFDCIFIIKN